jgi:hypothetical protein
MNSSLISRVSAAVLFVAGASLLFASDLVLPGLVSGYPRTANWLGQLLGAAWLGMAALNWWNRFTVLGGIHGRPVVAANLALYLVSALVLLRAGGRAGFPAAVWPPGAAAAILAIAYGVLLFRGPFQRDRDATGGA